MDQEKGIQSNSTIESKNVDWFLGVLIKFINDTDLNVNIPITVTTHGFLVSGNLAGGKSYFENFGNELGDGFNSITGGNEFDNIKDLIKNTGDEIYTSNRNSEGSPTYIHLKNAKFFHPAGTAIPGNRDIWWRGKLSEISGFSLGSLSVQ